MSFGGIFNMDSKFSQVMGRVFDLIVLNFIFILMCIPIITIGANFTAMYYVTLKMVRNEDSYLFRSYIKSFKENFRQATIIWLIFLFAGVFLVSDIYLSTNFMEGAASNLKYVFYFLGAIYCMTLLYVFPALSRFYNTIKHTVKNALLFSIRHLPYTILMLAIVMGPFLVCLNAPASVFSFYILFVLLAGFSATAYINSIFFNKIFKQYMPAEEPEQTEEDVIAHMDALAEEEQKALADGDAPAAEGSKNDTQP